MPEPPSTSCASAVRRTTLSRAAVFGLPTLLIGAVGGASFAGGFMFSVRRAAKRAEEEIEVAAAAEAPVCIDSYDTCLD